MNLKTHTKIHYNNKHKMSDQKNDPKNNTPLNRHNNTGHQNENHSSENHSNENQNVGNISNRNHSSSNYTSNGFPAITLPQIKTSTPTQTSRQIQTSTPMQTSVNIQTSLQIPSQLNLNPLNLAGVEYKPLSVSQITNDIKSTLEQKYTHIIVEGELSNYKKHSSGHSYFSLIENDSMLQCICWKSVKIPELLDGMKIVCTGKLTAYTGRSQFQLTVQSISIAGQGNLYKLFEELKNKLQKEGLFDPAHKKPMPAFPHTIGVITGANSDAMHDILIRIKERLIHKAIIKNVLVQGPNAPADIKKAIEYFNSLPNHDKPDVLILARGGGSIEDLAAFNDEVTVRAVFNSNIPIITGVGHEMDVTLVDYVSDKRAPTPTACVEMLLQKTSVLQENIQKAKQGILSNLQKTLQSHLENLSQLQQIQKNLLNNFYSNKMQKLDTLSEKLTLILMNKLTLRKQSLPKAPSLNGLYNLYQQKLNNFKARLAITQALDKKYNTLTQYQAILAGFDYNNVLKRGFCLAMDPHGQPITTALEAKNAKHFQLSFQDDGVEVSVV